MKQKQTPYKKPDAALKKILQTAKREFRRHRLRNFLPFDEINIIRLKKNTATLYQKLDDINRAFYLKIAREAYAAACEETGEYHGKELSEKWLIAALNSVDSVTEYVYTNEVKRKRDRFYEALLVVLTADHTDADIERLYRRALQLWQRQTEQYEINLVDRARRQAFADNGIQRYLWNTQRDGRVCATCAERDGMIYAVGEIPTRHYHCRCWLSAT